MGSEFPAAVSTNTVQSRLTGIYVPYGWGTRAWRPKLAAQIANPAAGNPIAAIVADSLAHHACSNPATKSWPALMRAALQSLGGNGGSGYKGAALTTTGVTTLAGATAAAAWAAAIDTTAGTWSTGTQGAGNYSITTAVGGSTVTVNFTGTAVDWFTIEGTVAATYTWAIDGGGATTITPSASNIEVMHSVTGLSAGNHTLVLTFTGASGTMFFNGATGRNATGVRVDTFARFGAATGNFVEAYGLGWNGGSKGTVAPDLLIFALAANDSTGASSGDNWETNIRTFLTDALDGTGRTGATDVILWLPHIGKLDASQKLFQDYCARARGLADAYGAALVNMWAVGRASWNYWNGLGYWGNSSTYSGLTGTDNVHLSDAGHQAVWNAMSPLVTATS